MKVVNNILVHDHNQIYGATPIGATGDDWIPNYKAIVDLIAGGTSLSFANGLTADDGTIKIGGPLIENTKIDYGNFELELTSSSLGTIFPVPITKSFKFTNEGIDFSSVGVAGPTTGSSQMISQYGLQQFSTTVEVGGTSYSTGFYSTAGPDIDDRFSIFGAIEGAISFLSPMAGLVVAEGSNGNTGIMIRDDFYNAGVYYENDFSTQGIALYGDNWIPNLGTVKSLVSGATNGSEYQDFNKVYVNDTVVGVTGEFGNPTTPFDEITDAIANRTVDTDIVTILDYKCENTDNFLPTGGKLVMEIPNGKILKKSDSPSIVNTGGNDYDFTLTGGEIAIDGTNSPFITAAAPNKVINIDIDKFDNGFISSFTSNDGEKTLMNININDHINTAATAPLCSLSTNFPTLGDNIVNFTGKYTSLDATTPTFGFSGPSVGATGNIEIYYNSVVCHSEQSPGATVDGEAILSLNGTINHFYNTRFTSNNLINAEVVKIIGDTEIVLEGENYWDGVKDIDIYNVKYSGSGVLYVGDKTIYDGRQIKNEITYKYIGDFNGATATTVSQGEFFFNTASNGYVFHHYDINGRFSLVAISTVSELGITSVDPTSTTNAMGRFDGILYKDLQGEAPASIPDVYFFQTNTTAGNPFLNLNGYYNFTANVSEVFSTGVARVGDIIKTRLGNNPATDIVTNTIYGLEKNIGFITQDVFLDGSSSQSFVENQIVDGFDIYINDSNFNALRDNLRFKSTLIFEQSSLLTGTGNSKVYIKHLKSNAGPITLTINTPGIEIYYEKKDDDVTLAIAGAAGALWQQEYWDNTYNETNISTTVIETSQYKLTRYISGAKIVAVAEIKPLADANVSWDIEMVPSGIAKFFKFQEYLQTVNSGFSNSGTGSSTSPPTIDFNKILEEGDSESFSFQGRGTIGHFARFDDYEYNTQSGGSFSPVYVPNEFLPDISTTGIIMTIDKTLAQEINGTYTITVEGLLIP